MHQYDGLRYHTVTLNAAVRRGVLSKCTSKVQVWHSVADAEAAAARTWVGYVTSNLREYEQVTLTISPPDSLIKV